MPTRLEKRRQLEALAQVRKRLIDRKAGLVGGDLEQHPAGLAEIDRPEVLAILLSGWMQVVIGDELARHCCLFAVVAGAKSDVMYRTATQTRGSKPRRLADIDDAANPGLRLVAHAIPLPRCLLKSEHACEHGSGRGGSLEQEGDAMKAPDRRVCGNGATTPGRLALGSSD